MASRYHPQRGEEGGRGGGRCGLSVMQHPVVRVIFALVCAVVGHLA